MGYRKRKRVRSYGVELQTMNDDRGISKNNSFKFFNEGYLPTYGTHYLGR